MWMSNIGISAEMTAVDAVKSYMDKNLCHQPLP